MAMKKIALTNIVRSLKKENAMLREYLVAIKDQIPNKTTVHSQADWARMSCSAVRKMAEEALRKTEGI